MALLANGYADDTPPARKARRTDPGTSRLAALRALPRQGTQRDRILTVIRDAPAGLTYDEAAARTGIVGVSVSTRMSELKRAGLIVQRGERVTSSGGTASVWVVGSLEESGRPDSEAYAAPLDLRLLVASAGVRDDVATAGADTPAKAAAAMVPTEAGRPDSSSESLEGGAAVGAPDAEATPLSEPIQLRLIA
ncbi:MAG: hypothetical protein M3540_10955 [Actinomycetota bacterium]|nr:hypothetical protein [Actinomycetota bacterium]